VIEVEGLTVRFSGVTPIDRMSVTFPGGTCGLIGPNGAGKTTFFNVLSGFVRPAAGSIRAFGEDLLGMADYKRARWGLRRTFQTEQAIEQLSVFDNVAMIYEHSGVKGAGKRAEVQAAIQFVGMETPSAAKVGGLGARERRLVEIARAVVGRPRVVLLDEPAAGLPEGEVPEFAAVVRSVRDEEEVGVLLIDHNMALVMDVCDRIQVLDQGRTLAEGTPAEVRGNLDVAAAYLGEAPVVE